MTNKDKYLKDGVDRAEFICGLRDYLDSHRDNYDTSNLINNYLNKQAKPTLKADEKVILKNIPIIYSKIRRYEFDLYVSRDNCTCSDDVRLPFDHLFQFIKPRRRI